MFVLQLRIARGVSELTLPKDNARYCNNSPKRNINKKSWTRINQKSLSNVINKHYPKEISSYYKPYRFISILISMHFDTYITYFIFLLLKAYLLFIVITVCLESFLDPISIWDN